MQQFVVVSLIVQMIGNHVNHYTYRIHYSNGKSYIGVRSCKHSIEDDESYVGSSKHTPNDLVISKEILGQFETREEAVKHEIHLHNEFNVATSNLFFNRSNQTSSKFDTSGVAFPRTAKHNLRIKQALTGRVRSPKECAAISKGKTGVTHKPHSDETKQKMRESRLGVDGYMKGQTYLTEDRQEKYASRVKHPEPYHWFNKDTGNTEYLTCVEMGYKYVVGKKPSQRFTNIVRGISKSYKGWTLQTDKD